MNGATQPRAPEELTRGRLRRIGEGVGNVVYASQHWVVKRERSPLQLAALIVVWRGLRKLERILPAGIVQRIAGRPSARIRLLRVTAQGLLLLLPKRWWMSERIRSAWKTYRTREWRGESLANSMLRGSGLIPEKITFPKVEVRLNGWPYKLTVTEAMERVECTLQERLAALAAQNRFDEVEALLDRKSVV